MATTIGLLYKATKCKMKRKVQRKAFQILSSHFKPRMNF